MPNPRSLPLPALGWRTAAVLALTLCLALPAWARSAGEAACPPAAQAPTPDQVRSGLAQARDRGLLWRLRKDGRTSYLYATVHLGRMEWIFPGKTVVGALRNADVVALELDVTDPAMAEQFLAAQPPLSRPLKPALQRRLTRQFEAACVAETGLSALHPVMQVVTLTGMAARREGLDPSYGQEYVLAGVARELRQPVIALETVASQMRALIPTAMDEIDHLMDQMLLDLEQDRVRKPLLRLAAAWENGLLHEFENYERWCECVRNDSERAFLRRLNDERNPALAQRIAALHDGGRKVFAAVGALHMTGPLAVQRLLAEQGFRVERVGLTP